MRYDKQTNTLHIPFENVRAATRDGVPVDVTSAFEVHQGGTITLTISKQPLPEKTTSK